MTIPCGCKVGLVRGVFLLACLKLGFISTFDKFHVKVG